ncbi:MAG: hypothetical protein AAGE52_00820 [Myxococcota bacterium]
MSWRTRSRSAWWALLWVWVAGCAGSPLESWGEPDGPAFYSYENDEGRTVFVSDPSLVPEGTSAEPFDVSHVDLNQELGNELNEAIEREHERLVESDFCHDQREGAARSLWEETLDHHGHWLAIGGVILLLLLSGPFVARRVGAPKWIRLLALVIPLLLFLGVLTHTLTSASRTLSEVRRSGELCEEGAVANAPEGERMGILQELRGRIEKMHRDREAQIEALRREAFGGE